MHRKPSPLTPEQVAKATELIEQSALDGKERAFVLCDGAAPGPSSKGDETGVTPKTCPSGREIGTYHTHPSGDLRPSGTDLVTAIEQKHETECIGGVVDGIMTIQCLEFKHDVKGAEKRLDDVLDSAAAAKDSTPFRERGIWSFPILNRNVQQDRLAAMDAKVEKARRTGAVRRTIYKLGKLRRQK